MSQENVEVVRRAYEAWASGGPEAVRPFAADEIEVHDTPEIPDGAIHMGLEAAVRRWHEYQEAWGDMPLEISELLTVGDEVVLIRQLAVSGRASGVGLSAEVAHAVHVENGKVTRQRMFFSRAEALEAVGRSD
jgi:ketosteroid isomerase-like protein